MKKRILAMLLCLTMVGSMLPVGAIAEGETAPAELQEAVLPEAVEETAPVVQAVCAHAEWTQWDGKGALPTSGNIILTDNVQLSAEYLLDGTTLAICLNGHNITAASGSRIFTVKNGAHLSIYDCAGTGKITGANVAVTGAAVQVEKNSRFDFHGGNITGNKSTKDGCGVYAAGAGATFNMHGGTISNNTTTGAGGGVCAGSGSVVNITGGSITGNTAANGGGVILQGTNPVVLLKDCSITGNTATSNAGGVYVGYKTPDTTERALTFSGNVVVTGNVGGSGKIAANVQFMNAQRVAYQVNLGANANIGVRKNDGAEIIAEGATAATIGNYTSDAPTKILVLSGGKLTLADKPAEAVAHANTVGYTACNHANTNWAGWYQTGSLPTESGTYYLTGNVTLTDAWKIAAGQNITICLNGCNITQNGTKQVIVMTGGKLNICDCTAKTENGVYTAGKITGANTSERGAGLNLQGSAEFNLYDGRIEGNTSSSYGGGLYIHTATFNMFGGSISSNHANSQGGGGLCINGNGIVNITGGTITGNSAGSGGAIIVQGNGNQLLLKDCAITGNSATNMGGGIYVGKYDTVTISGLLNITGNTAKSVASNLFVCSTKTEERAVMQQDLDPDSTIGIGIYLTDKSNVQVKSGATEQTVKCYIPDDSTKICKLENGKLLLVEKPAFVPNHADTEGYEACGHGSATWTDWLSVNSLPTDSGTYYLTEDVKLTDTWNVAAGQTITICLNGHSITQTAAGKRVIYVSKGTVNICDCTKSGRITGANVTVNGGAMIANGSNVQVNLYDITFSGNKAANGGAISVHGGANVTLNGVTVTGNTATAQGGGIYVADNGSKLTLENVTVTGNTTTSTEARAAGGVHVNAINSTTLKGKVIIDENFKGTDANKVRSNLEVDYSRLPADNALTTDSRIGLSVFPLDYTQAIHLVSKAAVDCYYSDDDSKITRVEGDVLHLVAKPVGTPNHTDTEGYETCGHGNVTWIDWFSGTSLPTASGTYYLTKDVNLTDTWNVNNGQNITICLNGYTINQSTAGKRVIYVSKGTVNICDCTKSGRITGADVTANGGAMIANGSEVQVNLYDITFTGNKAANGGAISIHGGAKVTLTGVTVTGNTATGQGGGIYVADNGSELTLENVTVTGNTTTSTEARAAGGVHVNALNSTTLKGKVIIDENFKGTDANKVRSNLEVDYDRLPADDALTTDSRIGLSVFPLDYTRAIHLVSKAAVDCYYSDDDSKITKVEGDILHLVAKPAFIPVHANTEGYTACDHDKLTWIGWDQTDRLPTTSGNYFLGADVELTKIWNAGEDQEITICLNGYSITQKTEGLRVIRLGSTTLNICDCTAKTENGEYKAGKITGGNTDTSDATGHAAMILATNGGTFRLYDGIITDNHTEGNGIVYVQKDATFELHGGLITGNTVGKQGGAIFNSKSTVKMYGGQIRGNEATGSGGAIYIMGGTFDMEGGLITENKSTAGGGGGIALKDASDGTKAIVTVSGGEVSKNVAELDGSGICMDSGEFILAGGEIKENGREGGSAGGLRLGGGKATISGGKIIGNIGGNAAGVFANCDLTISGGEITANIGTGNGPGVYMSAAKLTMTGGKIIGNEAGGNGGGIYLAQATMEMTGGEISGNRGGMGGGIYNLGGNLTIKDGLIHNNAGYKLGGGGVYSNNRFDSDNVTVTAEASLVIEGGTFSGNTSKTDGAGVRVDSGKFKMSGGLITENTAGGAAGGLCVKNVKGAEISGGIISKNKAPTGAGMYFTAGTLTISDVEISENSSTSSGAGLVMSSAEVKFSGGVIKNNTAKGDGAGLYVSNATLNLCGGKIQNNTAKKMCGGLLAQKDSKIYFSSGTISGNKATASSGGMLIQTGSTLKMSGGTVSNNKTEKHGGGIYTNKNSRATISGGLITGNHAVKTGGGVYAGAESYLALAGGTLTGNTTDGHGAALSVAGRVDMTGGKIVKNTAKNYGGGIYITESTMNFSGGLVEDNHADYGGGILLRGKGGVLNMSKNAKVLNNECKEAGGGIMVQTQAELYIDGGEICGNIGPASGGGIRLHNCPAEIKNAKINENISNGPGAGIYSNLSLIIKDSEVCNNKVVKDSKETATPSSGAIRTYNESTLEMENVKVIGNSCDGRAGAIEIAYNVDATIKNCTFADNTSTEQGGTFYIYWEGQAYLYDCTIDGGSAPKGGVVSMDAYGEIEFHDCLITDNQADEGGVAYQNIKARSVFDGCTIKNNVAKKNASVIWANGDVVLKDTLITENKDQSGTCAVYLTNVAADTESYFPGVYEIMGDTVVYGNEGGDMVLADNAFINIPGDGLGKDAKIQVKLQDQDITRWIVGPYNYEASGDGFLVTKGEQSLSELFMGSGEPAQDVPAQEQEQEQEQESKSKTLPLIISGGAAVVLLAVALGIVAVLRKKKTK